MKVYTRIVISLETGAVIDEESFDYDGEITECKSGGKGSVPSMPAPPPPPPPPPPLKPPSEISAATTVAREQQKELLRKMVGWRGSVKTGLSGLNMGAKTTENKLLGDG